jgi:hypothetical protein
VGRDARKTYGFLLLTTQRDPKRFIVHADEKLTAFLELERFMALRWI